MVTVNETNREPDGTFSTLEATDSITDPEGNTVTSLKAQSFRVQEEAVTFDETDLTITTTNTTAGGGETNLSSSNLSGETIVDFPEADLEAYDAVTYQSSGEQTRTTETVDDFEDGDISIQNSNWSGWSGDTSNLSAQSNTVLEGNFSAELDVGGFERTVVATSDSSINPFTVSGKLRAGSHTGNSGDKFFIELREGGSPWVQVDFRNDGTVDLGSNTNVASWNSGTTYDWEIQIPEYNGTARLLIDGVEVATTSLTDAPALDSIELGYAAATTNSPNQLYFFDLIQTGTPSSNVVCDVIDNNDNVLISDIPAGEDTDISNISTSKNPQLRFDISRDATSVEPAVTYAGESYFR